MKASTFFQSAKNRQVFTGDARKLTCSSCGLFRDCISPRMKPFGNGSKGIINVGEAPGKDDDKAGKQWQGTEGQSLQKAYRSLGIDLFEDCININSVNCRPLDDRAPKTKEIASCRRMVFKLIEEFKPRLIMLIGSTAVESVLGPKWGSKQNISKWRGFRIPDRQFEAYVCPVFDSSFVERGKVLERTIWMQDLEDAFSKLNHNFPKFENETKQVEIIKDLRPLDDIKTGPIEFDYETTGIRPFATGHRIVSCSIAYKEGHAFSFLMPKTKNELAPLVRLLENPDIAKMAHNIKFEDVWTEVKLKTKIVNWGWDSMLAAHVLDNRSLITGLKFQTYINFGVAGYNSDVAPFLTSKEKSANAMNTIMELLKTPENTKKLLVYGGLDSIYGRRLALKQMEELGYGNV